MNRRKRDRHAARRGAVLVMTLVCLALATLIGGVLLRWVVMEHKLLTTRADESQARWLAEAGLERAAARLAGDTGYAGETWQIAADELPSGHAGRVELRIEAVEDQPRRRSIVAEAVYPADTGLAARVRKQIIYQLPQEDEP